MELDSSGLAEYADIRNAQRVLSVLTSTGMTALVLVPVAFRYGVEPGGGGLLGLAGVAILAVAALTFCMVPLSGLTCIYVYQQDNVTRSDLLEGVVSGAFVGGSGASAYLSWWVGDSQTAYLVMSGVFLVCAYVLPKLILARFLNQEVKPWVRRRFLDD